MSSFTPIDLSTISSPDIVETISFNDILAAMVADLQSRDPIFNALVESDPAWKILEVAAYRETLIRQRVNDAARGVMLAYATGSDLDNLGAIFGTVRKIITPTVAQIVANQTALYSLTTSQVSAGSLVYETDNQQLWTVSDVTNLGNATGYTQNTTSVVFEADSDFRYRITLALEGLSTAGPSGAYLYHALTVSGVSDASVMGPYDDSSIAPGNVKVTILGNSGNGTPTSDVLTAVQSALTSSDIRPLTDKVTVQAVTVTNYTISASIYTAPGPDYSVILANAQTSAQAFADAHHKIGSDVPLSALYAALHVAGVTKVVLSSPSSDVSIDNYHVAYCSGVSLTWGGTFT